METAAIGNPESCLSVLTSIQYSLDQVTNLCTQPGAQVLIYRDAAVYGVELHLIGLWIVY